MYAQFHSMNKTSIIKSGQRKKNLTSTTMVIFWEFLTFQQFFLSPQAKRSLIISNKLEYIQVVSQVAAQLRT